MVKKEGSVKATCKGCGESNTADDEAHAESYIIHKNGCNCDLTNPAAWITFGTSSKSKKEE